MNAYMVNMHHIYTDFNELSSLIHDVVHYALPNQGNAHSFTIIKGKIDLSKKTFISDLGIEFPLQYEEEYDLYYI